MSGAVTDIELSRETLLQIAPGLRTRFDAAGHVLVDAPDGTVVDIGPRGYATLALFAQPVTLGDAIDRLEGGEAAATDVAPTMNVVNMLIEEGALVTPGAAPGRTSGWADPVEHGRMLDDDRRTHDYLEALAQAVRPDDVVLDIGTGSGVLAVAAARAGARHVYAVEASDIAEVAERVFAANDVQDRVTLIPAWSRLVELPEPADLLVAEIIGNEPLEEEILETTLDARRRLLKPGARLIPHALTLLARPLELPEAEARQRAVGRDAADRWRRLYGIELQPVVDAASRRPVNYPTETEVAARWPPAGPPVALVTLDLTAIEDASVDAAADLTVEPGCTVNAVAVTFRAEPPRRRRPHARSLDAADLELGDVDLGAPRRGSGRPRAGAARPVHAPIRRNAGRAHLRSGRGCPRLIAGRGPAPFTRLG